LYLNSGAGFNLLELNIAVIWREKAYFNDALLIFDELYEKFTLEIV